MDLLVLIRVWGSWILSECILSYTARYQFFVIAQKSSLLMHSLSCLWSVSQHHDWVFPLLLEMQQKLRTRILHDGFAQILVWLLYILLSKPTVWSWWSQWVVMAACHWYDLTLVTHSWKVYYCIHCHLSFRWSLWRFVWNFLGVLRWVHTNDAGNRPSIDIGCWLAYFKSTSLFLLCPVLFFARDSWLGESLDRELSIHCVCYYLLFAGCILGWLSYN